MKKKNNYALWLSAALFLSFVFIIALLVIHYFPKALENSGGPFAPQTVVDEGIALKAGAGQSWTTPSGGRYELQINADDDLQVYTFVSDKDKRLKEANQKFEYVPECSAENTFRLDKTCNVPPGGVFALYNTNLIFEIKANVKIVKVGN